MENSQIKRQSSAEVLAHRILALVHENELEVGSHIKEMEYAKLLKVSRTPIRGAFSYLQQEGS